MELPLEPAVEPPAEPPAVTVAEPTILETMDAPRDYLSEKIVAFTTKVDHFFGDERYYQEYNKSVIQLELHETFAGGGNHTLGFEGKAKLDLPAAEKRFHFVIESNPEKKTAGEVKKDQPVTPSEPTTPDKYAASLRYEKSEESLWHFSSDLGAKFQFPLDPFVRTRGSYAIQLEEWRLKVAETLFWFSTIGLGETTQFDMERVLSEPVLFRATSTATCFESPQNCDLRQDLSVFHTLNERSALLYQASVIGVSQPQLEETAYVLLTRYRYRLHREWVFFEITPQLNFPKTDDFKLNALLLLRLELLFGATK
ncbi:MAG TPA: hypothetical protein VMV48_09745 [Gallionellaceae bacterium]|nr:hypothetical protein [Gallionellaceae bacterium]